MYVLFFVLGFSVNFGLALYLVANAKSHAQPWRFLVAALVTIFLAYGLELGAEWINGLAKTRPMSVPDPILAHVVKLTNLICGAFAGALASVAITNRAKLMYDTEVEKLTTSLTDNDKRVSEIYTQLRKIMKFDPADPGDVALQMHNQEIGSRMLDKLETQRDELRKKLKSLGVMI